MNHSLKLATVGYPVVSALYWWFLVPIYRQRVLVSPINEIDSEIAGYATLALLGLVPLLIYAALTAYVLRWCMNKIRTQILTEKQS